METDTVTIAFHIHKIKESAERKQSLHKRIREYVQQRCLEMKLYRLPFILIDDGSYEAARFLEVCVNARCLMTHLFENIYFCPKHITVHACHEKSKTCTFSHARSGGGGSAYCVLSGMDLAQQDRTDDCHPDNKTKQISQYKASRDDKGSEDCYKMLKETTLKVVSNLCSQDNRRNHNIAIARQGSTISSRNKTLVLFDRNEELEVNLYKDALTLCELILRHVESKQETRLLLKNMISFVIVLIQKIVTGIYNKGVAILPPMQNASQFLDPLPCNFMLERHFGLKLTKYSECLNCVQHILEKPSFIHNVPLSTFHLCLGSNKTTHS